MTARDASRSDGAPDFVGSLGGVPDPDVAGTWSLTIATPIGRLPVTLVLAHDSGSGVLTGTATGRDETVPIKNIVAVAEPEGLRLTWQQAIARPMRLNLSFDVLVTGATMTGFSRAGRLPRSTVTGARVPQ